MYLGQAHFLEEAFDACGQPDLWRAKTNNIERIVPEVGAILAQFQAVTLYIIQYK
jgi:hypothetical protein